MKRSYLCWISLLLVVLMLAGCSAGNSGNAAYYANNSGASYAAREDAVGYVAETEYYSSDNQAEVTNKTSNSNIPQNVKIIYTANVEMETTAYDEAFAALKQLTEDMGGYMENVSTNQSGYYRYATMTVRVPAESFRAFLDASGNVAQVLSSRENAKDVSEYYYDTENRLATEKTKLARLQELLRKADTMSDIIELENAIADTEYSIDDLSGTLRHYDSLISFSTIDIRLNEVAVLRGQEVPPVTFGERLQKAWNTGCENAVTGLQDFVIGFSEHWLGWLIFIAVIIVIILMIRRSIRRRQMRLNGTLPKSRRELRKEAKAAKRDAKNAAKQAAKVSPVKESTPSVQQTVETVTEQPAESGSKESSSEKDSNDLF